MTAPTVAELRARVKPSGPWFVVHRGSHPFRCRSCGTETYWTATASGKRILADTDVEGGVRPTRTEAGRGVAHFATCPQSAGWSAKR